MNTLDAFYLNQSEPNKSCFLALKGVIRNHDPDISETLKYGAPCFLYRKKAFCYLWKDRKTQEPYLLWVEGNQLNHPDLEQGNRTRMKILRIDPLSDMPLKDIKTLIDAALNIIREKQKRKKP